MANEKTNLEALQIEDEVGNEKSKSHQSDRTAKSMQDIRNPRFENCPTYLKQQIQQNWIYAHTLFQSPYFCSAHVEDLKGSERLLSEIMKKGQMPITESLEGLKVLRSAWEFIDIGQSNLKAYKFLSKFIYMIMIVCCIVTVCLAVLSDFIDSLMTNVDANMTPTGSLIFYLSIASTFVIALNAYVNPNGRWKQIRDTTCDLESAIWQFRTRTGQFKVKWHETDASLSLLKGKVSQVVEELVTASDVGQSTSWSGLYSKSVFKHGQYGSLKSSNSQSGIQNRSTTWWNVLFKQTNADTGQDAVDDHHSPLTPEKYIQFRLKNILKFYKHRLPIYTRSRNILSVTMMMLTASGTILAYKQYSSYVPICATIAAAITSWMEYTSITTKIGRYNSIVSSLESLILWWSSIPETDKSNVYNIDALVRKGEQVVFSLC